MGPRENQYWDIFEIRKKVSQNYYIAASYHLPRLDVAPPTILMIQHNQIDWIRVGHHQGSQEIRRTVYMLLSLHGVPGHA